MHAECSTKHHEVIATTAAFTVSNAAIKGAKKQKTLKLDSNIKAALTNNMQSKEWTDEEIKEA
jgi:hypothetical protein